MLEIVCNSILKSYEIESFNYKLRVPKVNKVKTNKRNR